jgi:transposase InsO family protein
VTREHHTEKHVQRRLMAEAIRFRPIRPRSPHLNGKVERAQRTMLEEFWAVTDTKVTDIEDQLALWVQHYNWHRPHAALHGLTPIDRACARADKTPLWEGVSAAYEADQERIRVSDYTVDTTLQRLKRCL